MTKRENKAVAIHSARQEKDLNEAREQQLSKPDQAPKVTAQEKVDNKLATQDGYEEKKLKNEIKNAGPRESVQG